MAQVGKGQELSEQERRSIEFIQKLSEIRWSKEDGDDCRPLQPSNDWSRIRAVNFTKDDRNLDYAKFSFTSTYPVWSNNSGALCLAQLQKSPKSYGIEIHKKLSRFIKKRRGEKTDLKPDDEKQSKEFVENIEKCYKFRIIASELNIHGYANQDALDQPHCWRGRIDAIGVKKNGTIIVVEWRVCCTFPPNEFWDSRTEFPKKLHQTMIYREIIRARWKGFGYEGEKDVGILIVPMAYINIRGSAPRECLKFELLEEKRFFYKIVQFEWTAQKPSKDGDSLRREQEARKVKTEDMRGTRFIERQKQVENMTEDDVMDLLTTLLFLMDVSWKFLCDKDKQNLSEVLTKSLPDIKYASLAKNYVPQLQSVSEINKQESTMKAEEEVHSCKPKTPVGDCGNKMKSILERFILPYAEEIKQVEKPIAVKQEEQIRQMPDRQHLSGRTPTNSYRTAEMSEIIKQESTVKAERVEVKEEDYSRKHKTPDGDCGKKMKSILQPPIPPYVEEIKEVRNPITVKQEEQRRQMFDRQHVFGWTPADSNRTDKMSEIIKQESTVKAEGEDYLRKHKTLDGDCGNKMKSIFEPRIPLYVEEIKEVRKPIAVKHDEPIRQMPDWQHLFGRTPKDSYPTAEMCDTRNAAVGHVTQMPNLQHYIARTPVHRYFTPEEARQAHSSYIQSGISAAQMVYRESAELNAYHFMEKAGCSCHGRKKCAHARGAGQCDCKAAGKKCGYNCNCDERICTNRAW